jgi:hypothetical protein
MLSRTTHASAPLLRQSFARPVARATATNLSARYDTSTLDASPPPPPPSSSSSSSATGTPTASGTADARPAINPGEASRTVFIRLWGGVQDMVEALAVLRAVEREYGPLRDYRFLRVRAKPPLSKNVSSDDNAHYK